jgi:hypothetical protein
MKTKQNSKRDKIEKHIKGSRPKQLPANSAEPKLCQSCKALASKKTTAEKINAPDESNLLQNPSELPELYDETRVVVLPIDPHLVHVYWKIAPLEFENSMRLSKEDLISLQLALRFYEVTNISDRTNATSYFDVDVEPDAKNWYVRLVKPGASYFVELGLKGSKGVFFPLVRSNFLRMPPDRIAAADEVTYMLVKGDYKVAEVSAPHRKRELLCSHAAPSVSHQEIGPELNPAFPFINNFRFVNRSVLNLTEMSEMALDLGISSDLFQNIKKQEEPFVG